MGTAATKQANGSPPDSSAIEGGRRLFDVVKMNDVTLLECRAHVRGRAEGPLRLGLRRSASGSRSDDRARICAQVCFTLEGRQDDEDARGVVLLIEATFNATYEVPVDHEADKGALDFFAQANGTFNLWPYWREFVQATAARMGIPALTVPTYRIEEAFTGPGSAERTKVKGSKPQTQRKPRKESKQ